MTDVAQEIKKSEKKKKTDVKKTTVKSTKSDATLLKDAKERIMRRQKKPKKDSKNEGKVKVKTTRKNTKKRGVVYLGHIPHGFYEEELRGFFSQFGEVVRVKVSRSRKTGKSKGYAFIEFAFNDVAKIVAETMNNYLMFERLVKAEYIPPEKVHSKMFPIRFMTPESYPALVRRNRVMAKQDKPVTENEKNKHRSRIQFKIDRAVSTLKELGIEHRPQIYYPEAGQFQNEIISLTNDDEVPQLVAIQPSTPAENKQSKKVGKALKKDNAEEKPTTDSTPAKLTDVAADPVSVAVQPTTPEKISPLKTRNKRKSLAVGVEVKPTIDSSPAVPTKAEKVLKIDQKALLKTISESNAKESPKGKRKSLAVTEKNSAASVAVSQSPSKGSKPATPTDVAADPVPVAVQPTTPEKISPLKTRNQRKSLAVGVEVKPTTDFSPAAPTKAEKVLKIDQKALLKTISESNAKESPKGKRKSFAVTETNPAVSFAVSQSPSKRSKSATPAKADKTPLKKDSKMSAKPSPQSAKTSEKA